MNFQVGQFVIYTGPHIRLRGKSYKITDINRQITSKNLEGQVELQDRYGEKLFARENEIMPDIVSWDDDPKQPGEVKYIPHNPTRAELLIQLKAAGFTAADIIRFFKEGIL